MALPKMDKPELMEAKNPLLWSFLGLPISLHPNSKIGKGQRRIWHREWVRACEISEYEKLEDESHETTMREKVTKNIKL